MLRILYIIPKNYLSYYIGKLVAIEVPKPLATWIIKAFAKFFKIDYSNASREISDYKSIADLFTRDLKNYPPLPGAPLVTPAESALRAFGSVKDGQILQVKGVSYSVSSLLGGSQFADVFKGGTFFNFYLSPKDYHQVHSPVSGEIYASSCIKGKLWPVNDWSLNNIEGLFAINERLVTYINSDIGKVALVMVGATNVGKITVHYDDWLTNNIYRSPPSPDVSTRSYQPSKAIKQGDKLGVFHMGSAVILLLEKDYNVTLAARPPAHLPLFTALNLS